MATKIKLITYDDYRELPDDGKRYEIIGGELLMTPSPKTKHQRISHKLEYELESYLRENKIEGYIFDAPMDVVLSMTDVVQPDIFYISEERSHIITEKNIVEAPDFVVEISSESTKVQDRTSKKTLFEKYGVKEYWIVYPDEKQVEQFLLQDNKLELRDTFQLTNEVDSKVINEFSIMVDQIFAD